MSRTTPTAAEIAGFLGLGTPAELASIRITGAAAIDRAEVGAVSFVTPTGPAAEALLRKTKASLVLVREEVAGAHALEPALLSCANPRLAFIQVLERYFAAPTPAGVHPSAVLDASAQLGADVYVGPLATIGADVVVGDHTAIHAGVHIYHGCSIGAGVTIHAGTVIGADGFGYERTPEGRLKRFPHIGRVVIEDDVEIGANACIDRGALGTTVVRTGARIDNLVHVAHNVEIGRHSLVIALAMVGGGTTIGDGSLISSSALRDNIRVGAGTTVGLGAVVLSDVPDGATVAGSPAREIAELRAMNAALRKLAARPDPPG